ncbi:hypothetical protein [Rhodococcus sp. NPDC055024]
MLASSYGAVDAVPKHRVRTPLHRVVQILNRHRGIYFADDFDDRPPSSLITTLAGQAYEGEIDLVEATMNAVQRMPEHIEKRDGRYWVENPACRGENFADKWNEYENRRLKFEGWRAAVERDLTDFLLETKGRVALHHRVAKVFGNGPVEEALKTLGARTSVVRENGNVHFTTGGLLTTATPATAVPTHRFSVPKPRGRQLTITQQVVRLRQQFPDEPAPVVKGGSFVWSVLRDRYRSGDLVSRRRARRD